MCNIVLAPLLDILVKYCTYTFVRHTCAITALLDIYVQYILLLYYKEYYYYFSYTHDCITQSEITSVPVCVCIPSLRGIKQISPMRRERERKSLLRELKQTLFAHTGDGMIPFS